jgi:antitoxin PrlF
MPLIEKVATITAKGQTTIPKAVRQALGADYGGKIAYRIDEHGVSLHRVEVAEDPALSAFLAFLATDMRSSGADTVGLVRPAGPYRGLDRGI